MIIVKIKMILAMDEGNLIGNQGDLPWRLSSDLRRFKKLTKGDGYNAVVMGRKTWESIPESNRPLPDRLNIVMSRDSRTSVEGAEVALYDGRAIEIAYSEGCEELWVIGGSQIYNLFLARCDEIHLPRVHQSLQGDTTFDGIDTNEWDVRTVERVFDHEGDDFDSTYTILIRK